MPFPISRNRSFTVSCSGRAAAHVAPTLAAIEEWLGARGAGRIRRSEGELAFRAGLLPLLTDWSKTTSKRLALGWNPLMTVGSGQVRVVGTARGIEVSYSLRFTELIIFSFILFLIFVGAIPDDAQINRWASAAWFGLVPVGYLVASTGIGVALEAVAREAVAESSES